MLEKHREIWMLWSDELNKAEVSGCIYVSVFDLKDNTAYMRKLDNVFSSVEEAKIACAVAGAEWRELSKTASDDFLNAATLDVMKDSGILVAELEENTVSEAETSS